MFKILSRLSVKRRKKAESVTGYLRSLSAPLGVVYVSSYIPRKCGIATYTKYLTDAMNSINPLEPAKIIALDNPISEKLNYPHEVLMRISDNKLDDYREAAKLINNTKDIELVSLQHEFGLYGENHGEKVIKFVSMIKKPIVTTVHSVRSDLGNSRHEILNELYKHSHFSIVMLDVAKDSLSRVLENGVDKVVSIPHGVLDFPKMDTIYYKKRLRLKGKTLMTSINLLSEWKGIEYAIKAVPKIIKHVPNFLYLVIGETHPSYILAHGGDTYRDRLKSLVKQLHIEKHIRFINKYVSLSEQKAYIGASDFYITPYLDPQQVSSGALAFALGAGKVCISTPYIYAKEILQRGKGILVPFKNSTTIANAIISLVKNPEKRQWYENEAYEKGRLMSWFNVAHQYYHLYRMALNRPH